MFNSQLLVGTFSALSILALFKIIKKIRSNALSKTYFKNKTILITGASSGLGKAIAEEIYKLGGQVILCARNVKQLENVKNDLMKSFPGKEPVILCLDVSSTLEVMKPKIEGIIEKCGNIDVLVNNAGVSFRGESFSTDSEVFEKIINVNFLGIVRLTNLVLSYMIKDNDKNTKLNLPKRNFSIVNIGSVQSYLGIPYRSAYCSSKHALLAYADSLRAELYAHRNIDVVNCQPGYINTNVSINALTSAGTANNSNDDDHRFGFDPNYVGQIVIDSIINRKKEVLITIFLHRLAIWARFFAPNIFAAFMYKRAKGTYDKKFQ